MSSVSSHPDIETVVNLEILSRRWSRQSLAVQFLLAGGLVCGVAMLIVGAFVTNLIEASVTRNSAATTALYVDSVIAPILPDMQQNKVLDDSITRALDETLGQGALGQRIMSFRLWRRDGTIMYSNDPSLIGKKFPVNEDLKAAFDGEMSAEFNDLDEDEDVESVAERDSGKPLLEIYNPVLQPWSGDVVAVAEFYEVATDFQKSLELARLKTWLAVALFTVTFFVILSFIVLRGSRTIAQQRAVEKQRYLELLGVLNENRTLNRHLQQASNRVIAYNERYLRRIGAELHDGPVQLIAFAALRLDSKTIVGAISSPEKRLQELSLIHNSLGEALREIRGICGGLVLPHIETLSLSEVLELVVRAHEQRTESKVHLTILQPDISVTHPVKIAAYRFVQESLNNAFKHANGTGQEVRQDLNGKLLEIVVTDRGPGFDIDAINTDQLGLLGLKERIESLGGKFHLESEPGKTTLKMQVRIDDT
ncbi:histidine kinase [Metarhizobium album]|uniref:histidine kinase n=1 Tax=Metarhizobium album TaxID=2182425 RepID=A0A2U2DFL2_9HYPH|nr:histidine kinase [Rhizobium album]